MPSERNLSKFDKYMAPAAVEEGLAWYDVLEFTVEGRGWSDLDHPFDRLPARAEAQVTEGVWHFSRHAAGICIRFVTDAPSVSVRWALREPAATNEQMPVSTTGGLDLYARSSDRQWRWAGLGLYTPVDVQERKLVSGIRPGEREYLLYLSPYGSIDWVRIGLPADARVARPVAASSSERPIAIYGTSITQGGCCSRAGMPYPAILRRRLECEVLNLGFSGSARMEPAMADLLGELDASCYVIDPLANMMPEQIQERYAAFIRRLRGYRSVPILMLDRCPFQNAWLSTEQREKHEASNKAFGEAVAELQAEGIADLHRIRTDDFLGSDSESTTDGAHLSDIGALRFADALEPKLRAVLSLDG